MIDLEKIRQEVLALGPERVLINEHETMPPKTAKRERGIEPDVILIRDDGWTLGAPEHLQGAAFKMWQKEWVAVLYRPFDFVYQRTGPVTRERAEEALRYLANVNNMSVEEARRFFDEISKEALREINSAKR